MTINIKNFLKDKTKLSKMGEFQNLKQIDGLEMSSVSADLYGDGRDDLALFYFSKGANYASLTTTNSITSEFIPWNNNSHKKIIKGLLVNTKNANTFTGKQGKEGIDIFVLGRFTPFLDESIPPFMTLAVILFRLSVEITSKLNFPSSNKIFSPFLTSFGS